MSAIRKQVYHHHPTNSLVTVHHLGECTYAVDRFGVLWVTQARSFDDARDWVDIHMNKLLIREGKVST